MTVEAIHSALTGHAIRTTDEGELGSAVAQLLTEAGVPFEREFRLSPRDRIDFMVGSVGVELKVDGSIAELIRQLDRYAKHDVVSGLVLVSTRRKHLYLPTELQGKRVTAICLGGL